MSLRECIESRGLDGHLRTGLRALGQHSRRVSVTNPRKATHSIDLDEAQRAACPNDPRWDYGIGIARGQVHTVAWVEVHTATSGEVDAVLKKLMWLQEWLRQGEDACQVTRVSFHWVATDAGVHIDAARRRKLNAQGLKMPQSLLRL